MHLHGLEFEAKQIDYRAVEEINLLVRVEDFFFRLGSVGSAPHRRCTVRAVLRSRPAVMTSPLEFLMEELTSDNPQQVRARARSGASCGPRRCGSVCAPLSEPQCCPPPALRPRLASAAPP